MIKRLPKAIYIIMLCAIFMANMPLALATDYSSTNFTSRDPVLDSFGGRGSSSASGFQNIGAGSQISTGESTSTNFIARSGFLYFNDFSPVSQNWRWYDDETNETPTTALAAENTAPTTVDNQNIVKLRVTIHELGGIAGTAVKYKLQYSTSATFSSGITDLVASSSCAVNSIWCYANGAGADNGVITTKVLSDADSCASSVGNGCGTHNESGTSASSFNHKFNAATEFEFTIKEAGANINTPYYFRVYDVTHSQVVPLANGKSYPNLTTQGTTLVFTVSGLPNGTTTGGTTTTISTTATKISFGNLPVNTNIDAAQRLTVTTNATQGYEVYVFQEQPFISSQSDQILPITGTNASPVAWTTGCPTTAVSCYGYHSADGTLLSGSTRFATDDTYAKLESTPMEIVYSATPVVSEVTDIVYRTRVSQLQVAGSYKTTPQYIIVPTF